MVINQDFDDNLKNPKSTKFKNLAGSIKKDLESLLLFDKKNFQNCSINIIDFLPVGFVKVNLRVIMTGEESEVKSFIDIKVKEAKNKILTNTKGIAVKDVSAEDPTVVGKFKKIRAFSTSES